MSVSPFVLKLTAPDRAGLSDILAISQQAASAHLEQLGLTGAAERRGLVWVIVRIRAEILGPVSGPVTCETWPAPARGGFLPRHCRIFSPDGRLLARLVTVWVLADAGSRTLAADASFPLPEILTGQELPVPRGLPRKEMEPVGKFRVQPAWIDANGHMNNTRYPEAVETVLGGLPVPKAVSIDYRAELLPDAEVTVRCLRQDTLLRICGEGPEKEHFRMLLEY